MKQRCYVILISAGGRELSGKGERRGWLVRRLASVKRLWYIDN
jgi:hypothetical protein